MMRNELHVYLRKIGHLFIGIIFCHTILAQNIEEHKQFQKLELPPIFSNHIVLQQKTKAKIWGNATPHTKVAIIGSWGKKAKTISDHKGNWKTCIKTPKAGGPYQIVISNNKEKITLTDVMIGEVWLCSGQSNMRMPLKGLLPKDPIEGSEEGEIFDLVHYLKKHKELLESPTLVVCLDSVAFTEETITITSSLRGCITFDLKVTVAENNTHSGMGGGVVPNPYNILNCLLMRVQDFKTQEVIPEL